MHRLTSGGEYLSVGDVTDVIVVVIVVGADVERFLFADDKAVVETDATGPGHLRADDGPLQSASSVREPVGHLDITPTVFTGTPTHTCIHSVPKNSHLCFLVITSANEHRFSQFVHYETPKEIFYRPLVEPSTSP